MDYGAIIKRAWHITWRYKALWVLGIFAGVSGCQGSGSGSSGGNSRSFTNGGSVGRGAGDFYSFLAFLERWAPALIAGLLALIVLGLVWSIFRVAARGGLVIGVNEIEEGRDLLPLGGLWSAGFRRFWTLVGLEILLQLPILAVVLFILAGILVPIFGSLAGGREPGAEIIAPLCGSLAIGIPVLLVMSFVLGVMYLIALRYVMLGNQGVFEAAGNSWRFFRARFKDSLIMWFINAGLNIVASLAVAIPMVIVIVAFMVPMVPAAMGDSWSIFAGLMVVLLLVVTAISFAYSAVWGTNTSALWTIFFRAVQGMGTTGIKLAPQYVAPASTSAAAPVAPAPPAQPQAPLADLPQPPPAPAEPTEPPAQTEPPADA